MLILHLSIWFHFSTRNHCKLSGMYCRLITCLEQWMSLLYLYFNQPPSRTGVASRWVVIYFIRLTKELIIATSLLIRQLPADSRFKGSVILYLDIIALLSHLVRWRGTFGVLFNSSCHATRIYRSSRIYLLSLCSQINTCWEFHAFWYLCSHLLEGLPTLRGMHTQVNLSAHLAHWSIS